MLEGPLKGKSFAFDEHDIFLFGRASNCHVSVPGDNFVSRFHCILVIEPPELHIRDLGSLNGTYVNGKKQGGRDPDQPAEVGRCLTFPDVELVDGDHVQIGQSHFKVAIRKPPPSEVVIRCASCKAPVPGALEATDKSDWLCARCQVRAAEAPQDFLRTMVRMGLTVRGHRTGEKLSDYKLQERLGEGGMGFVHLAKSSKDGRQVILKVLHSQLAADEHNRKTFLREMAVLRELQHENIVQYLDYGDVGNTFFFVMEYCNGGGLEGLMQAQGGKVPWETLAPLMRQTLRGLDHAHQRGIVHRDLKPDNVFLHNEGDALTAKVGDFGLAKNFQRAGMSRLTAVGEYGGTYNFMAREQLTNFKFVKPCCDVWSAGATFYYLLTGQVPRERPEQRDPVDVVLEDKSVPIQERGADLPEALAKVINRAIASEVDQRYATAGDMLKALDEAL